MFELKKTEGKARRGEFTCAHGTVQTPVFMNVGTQGAIKGALSAEDLKNIGCQVELSNTYHLHLRPTDKIVREKKLTAIMVTHNLRYAVEYGNRLIMMHEGNAILDKAGADKEQTQISDILSIFNEISIECGN